MKKSLDQAIIIEPLLPRHQDFLWRMLYMALYVPPGEPPFPRSILNGPRIAAYAREWGRRGDLGLLARNVKARCHLGAAWIRMFPPDAPGFGYVDTATPELSMAVIPDFRGRGIGRRLLTELLRLAAGRYAAVSLSVAAENPAQRLYASFGFKMHRRDGDSLTMRRRL